MNGPINIIPQALAEPHVLARQMLQPMRRRDGTEVSVIGFPGKFSATPASYRKAPPAFAEDTAAVMAASLGLDAQAVQALVQAGVLRTD